jgi:hypothetical protein
MSIGSDKRALVGAKFHALTSSVTGDSNRCNSCTSNQECKNGMLLMAVICGIEKADQTETGGLHFYSKRRL